MSSGVFVVSFTNEVHGVPCGTRMVKAKIGRKWVYLTFANRRQRKRIPRSTWDRMHPIQYS